MAVPSIVATSASTTFSGDFSAAKAFDGLGGTRWAATTTTGWLRCQLASAYALNVYGVQASDASGEGNRSPQSWTFEGSNDGSSWTTLDTRSGETGWGQAEVRFYPFTNSTAYTYYRLNISANNGGSLVVVTELVLAGAGDRAAAATENLDPSYTSKQGVDGNASTLWAGTGTAADGFYWVAPSADVYTEMSMSPHAGGLSQTPSGWTLAGSADGKTWTTLDTRSSVSWPSSSAQTFTFSNSTAYRFFRLSSLVSASSAIAFGEVSVGGAATSTTGSIAATAPAAASSAAGTVTQTGAIAATAPAATSSAAGTVTATGSIAATAPSAVAAAAGVSDSTATGAIAATAPAAVTSVAGVVAVQGDIAASAPAAVAAAVGTAGDPPSGPVELDAGVDLTVDSFESQAQVDAGDTVLLLDAGVQLEVVMPLTPAAPPLGVLTEWPIQRNSQQMPALTAASPTPGTYPVVTGDVGRLHYFVDGVDVTYLRNVPMTGDYTTAVPFQSVSASLNAPQQKVWDEPGVGDLAPFDMTRDPSFDVVMVKPDDSLEYLWEGFLAREQESVGRGRLDFTYHAEGLFMQAGSEPFDPPVIQRPIDPGHLIADILNSVTHRRWTKIPRFTTGLPPVTDRGQTGQTKWQRVQDILAKCIDSDLRQLTLVKVARRTYRLAWKQATTVDQWSVTKGAHGVDMDLSRDQSTRVDTIFGRGVALDGGAWGNFYFPGLEFYKIPAYPMAGFAIMYAGTTDAMTTTGRGVTDWQKRMRFIGYPVSVDGVLNNTDLAWVRRIQKASGILVDGQLGPQTWAATFNPGKYEQNLKRVRLPLATSDDVEPWLWSATGAVLGPNPQDDPSKIRRALDVDFGSMNKADAFPLAENMRELLAEPAWVGTINLLTDFHEGSRFEAKPGDNVKPLGHRDEPNLQVAEVRVQGLEVALTVDSIGRDILAVDAVLQRDRDARRDPTARTSRRTDMLGLNKSEVVEYESESKAGFFPRTAVNGNAGLWTVLPIFVSQIGVAKIEFTATAPKAELVVALCSKPITANRIASLVPDPLSSDSGWYDNVETLKERYGVLEVFGTPGNPGGYWPRQKGEGSLTGVLKDSASLLYESAYGGFVWVAVFTSVSTWVEGRVFPATSR